MPETFTSSIDVIFSALILSKITYNLLTFAGQVSVTDKNKINTFFCKALTPLSKQQITNVLNQHRIILITV